MKQEVEVAMRLLEKDGHDKQELVASLRKQLEDVKNINIDMSNRLQVCNVLNLGLPTLDLGIPGLPALPLPSLLSPSPPSFPFPGGSTPYTS